jgi:hypothetical protein
MESAINFLTGGLKVTWFTEMVSCWFSANPTYVVTTFYLKSRKDRALGMVGNPWAMLLLILRPNEGPMGRKYRAPIPSGSLFLMTGFDFKFCTCLLFNFAQKLLMDPNLDCSDPEYKRIFSLDHVGYRLENAGLVFFFVHLLFPPK